MENGLQLEIHRANKGSVITVIPCLLLVNPSVSAARQRVAGGDSLTCIQPCFSV